MIPNCEKASKVGKSTLPRFTDDPPACPSCGGGTLWLIDRREGTRELVCIECSEYEPVDADDPPDSDLPFPLRNGRKSWKQVYRIIRDLRASQPCPIWHRHIVAEYERQHNEPVGKTTVYQAVAILRRMGLVERSDDGLKLVPLGAFV